MTRDWLAEIAKQRDVLDLRRGFAAEAEKELAVLIRGAVEAGGSVTGIARAAGLSRERVYQIRDGRR